MQERMTDDSKYSRENPFTVPEGYFDAIEDRIEEKIRSEETGYSSGHRFMLVIKPVLAVAACFAIAFLVIYYPVTKVLPTFTAKQTDQKANELKLNEDFISGYGDVDENTFFMALTSEKDSTSLGSDEILTFLSAELDDYEVYSEIMN